MWRLPVLLVEDFAEVTPLLLKTAYVEAMYRASDFQYHRLTMSYWYTVILNVSSSRSLLPVLEAFPLEAEDQGFTRPREVYECGKRGDCGNGNGNDGNTNTNTNTKVKRIPRESC